jgi:hypothetical protein
VGQGEAVEEGVFVVGGIRNVDAFDGVLVGEQVGDQLVYRGVVEWGFRAHDVLTFLRHAEDYGSRLSPFSDLKAARNVIWLEDRLRAEVAYSEVSRGVLRAPLWRGLVTR